MRIRTLVVVVVSFLAPVVWARGQAQEGQPEGQQEPAARRRPGIQIGPGRLTFRFRPRLMYDDNIFLTDGSSHDDDEQSDDLIFLAAASVHYALRKERFQLAGSWQIEQWMHQDQESADRTEHRGNGRLRVEEGYFYAEPAFIYQRVAQPIELDPATMNVVVRMFRGGGPIGVKVGELLGAEGPTLGKLRLEYDPSYVRLTSPTELVAFYEHKVVLHTLRLRAPFADNRIEARLEGTLGSTDFDAGIKDDNTIRRVRGGLRWRALDPDSSIGELLVEAHLGHECRNYRRDTGTLPFTEDFVGPVADAGVIWKPLPAHTFLAAASLTTEESTLTNFQRVLVVRGGWSWQVLEELVVSLTGTWEQSWESTASPQRFKHRRELEGAVRYSFTADILGEIVAEYHDKATNDDLGEYDKFLISTGVTVRF